MPAPASASGGLPPRHIADAADRSISISRRWLDAPRLTRGALHQMRWLALYLLPPAFLMLLWHGVTQAGWMPPQILPAPGLVFKTLVELLQSGEIASNLLISSQRIGLGFALGCAIGLPLGVLLGVSPQARAYMEPTLKALFAIPTIGWIPILILIFGIDETLKVLVIAKAAMVPIVINTSRGIREVPARFFEVAQVLQLKRRTRLFKLILPASLPAVFSGLRLGISNAFIALIVVEMLAATEGIGYMMVWGRKLFQLDMVLVGIFVVGAVGLLIDFNLRKLERRISRWERADA
ncbi:MAG: ABC transporter permease [Burkholderiaceae bacterium]|nr:ABC transporter permease [Burkholderiaceae bacterium]